MKKKLIIVALVAIALLTLVLTHMPKRFQATVTACTGSGETADFVFDIQYFPNLIWPAYVKGTVTMDGVEYIDEYTARKEFHGKFDNRLFPSDWWKSKSTFPYNMTFVRSDCTDVISASLNKITVLDAGMDQDICKILLAYTDKNNRNENVIPGVNYWAPAKTAEEAKEISEFLGYVQP